MNKIIDTLKKLPGVVGKFILRYSKYFFPGFALIITAIIVAVALDQNQKAVERQKNEEIKLAQEQEEQLKSEKLLAEAGAPLEENDDEKLKALIEEYYAGLSNGDTEKLLSICDNIDESEVIRLSELSNYVSYEVVNVFSQSGPEDGSYIAYAYCLVTFSRFPEVPLPSLNALYIRSREEGDLYIVKGDLNEEENDYISVIAAQDDVRELHNKVNVEYNDIIVENPQILDYLIELDTTVSTSVGEKIAQLNATKEAEEAAENEQADDTQNTSQDGSQETVTTEPVKRFATATTRVNVRASDSAKAERVGEAMTGERFEVVEELVNGWTKIIFQDKEAYIKSEYLNMIQSAEGQPTIGMLTAKSEVNVRSLPEADSERVGALLAGDQLEIVAMQDGWCCVKFEGTLAYVNSEFVEYTIFE